MATRLHVTATWASESDIRRIYTESLGDAFANINIESTPPWSFFTTSVWSVGADKLIAGLEQLGTVGMQATTEDDSRWYLTIVRPCQPSLSFMHDFDVFRQELHDEVQVEQPEAEEIDPRLMFLEPEFDPATVRPWSQFDELASNHEFLKVPTAMEFRDSVAGMKYGAAVNRFREYEVARLTDALADAGIKFDRQTLLDALLWNSTSNAEDDGGTGNLCRVLFILGLGGHLADVVVEHDKTGKPERLPPSAPEPVASTNSREEFDESDDECEYDEDDHDEDDEDSDDEVMSEEDWRDIASAEQEMQEMMQQQRRKLVHANRERPPRFDRKNVVYRGVATVYWASDMANWESLDPKQREEFHQTMAEMSFGYLGDFVCKKLRDHVQRFYISPDRLSYGVILANDFGYLGYEFVSHFEIDSHLTTSTNWMAHSYPEVEVYAQHCPELKPPNLYERHRWGIERFKTHKQTGPITLDATLAGVAKLFDLVLDRMKNVESKLISFETIDLDGN